MELRALMYISRLADFGSVTGAARDLGIVPSTLSRHVGALERELGVLLFERRPGGTKTTPVGSIIVRMARRVIGDVDAIRQIAARTSQAQAGELRLATRVTSLGPALRAALTSWRTAHPGVRLQILEVDDEEALAGLRSQRVDAAVILSQSTNGLSELKLWLDSILVIVPDFHSLAKQSTVQWRQIRMETVMLRGATGSDTLRSLQIGLLGPGVDVRVHPVGLLDLINLVAMGEGIALVCGSDQEITFPGIRFLTIAEANAKVPISLTWRTELEDPVVGSFVASMRDWVKAHPQAETALASQTPDLKP